MVYLKSLKYDNTLVEIRPDVIEYLKNKENDCNMKCKTFMPGDIKIKIIDFNVSRSRRNVEYDPLSKKNMILYSIAGTPNFSAPEILESMTCYTEQIDIWSIGCIIFYLSIGKLPYNSHK